MNERVNRMNYGSSIGLDRHDCTVCQEETLHRHGACVHCGKTTITGNARGYSMRKVIEVGVTQDKARFRSWSINRASPDTLERTRTRGMQRIRGER